MEFLRSMQHRALRQAFYPHPAVWRQSFRQISYSSQQPFRTRPYHLSTVSQKAFRRPFYLSSAQPLRRLPRRSPRYQSTLAGTSDQNLSVSQRLRKLSREYGWSALGVYLLLSALDFPFCFLAVKLLGTDRIGHWEHVILSYIKNAIQWPLPAAGQEQVENVVQGAESLVRDTVVLGEGDKRILEEGELYHVEDHGYNEAEKANRGDDASIWTQLALAYAIHKSFIFMRVPLTAAVTPKVVKTLRGWGWNIGKRPAKRVTSGPGTGVNTKGTGVKPE